MYNISFKDIVNKLLPLALRKERVKAFLYALIKPLKDVNSTFSGFKDGIDYELRFNGQTIYLEHILNDKYDSILKRIYIEDTSAIDYTYLFNEVEAREKFYLRNLSEATPPIYLENITEQVNQTHFKVKVPSTITFSTPEMEALVDKYRKAGTNYTIETF